MWRSGCVFLDHALSPELSTVEQVDLLLLKNDSGVESALLYAKAWSKYTKDVLAWVEKRLSLGQSIIKAWSYLVWVSRVDLWCFMCSLYFTDMECAKSFAKMAESAKAVASQQVMVFLVHCFDQI